MIVPLIDLKAQYLSIKDEIDSAIARVLSKGDYVMGKEVEAFEEEWAKFCQAKYCVGVASGTDALYLSLSALGSGRDVITTPFTFFATTQAILWSGNRPVFIDIGEDGNLPPEHFYDFAVPVHLYGLPGDWRGDYVVEDMAQAHGVPLKARIGCFSFYPTKNLGAMGQAGAVVTNDKDLVARVRGLRTYGERERFVHYALTGNHRMDEIQAAILRAKLPHLTEWNLKRRGIAFWYRALLADVPDIKLPEDHPQHVYHAFVIRVKNRDSLAHYLTEQGIQTAVRYPLPMHLQPSLKYLGYKEGAFPVAEEWASSNLSLPIYPEMSLEMVEYVAQKVKEWARRSYHPEISAGIGILGKISLSDLSRVSDPLYKYKAVLGELSNYLEKTNINIVDGDLREQIRRLKIILEPLSICSCGKALRGRQIGGHLSRHPDHKVE